MDLMRAIDSYCERLDPSFWAEPLNALSNAAFLIGALIAWRIARADGRAGDWAVRALVGMGAVIGIGSFLFHTFATAWAAMADVIPILLFILLYIHLATVRYLALPVWAGLGAAALFLPSSAGISWTIQTALGPLNGSAGYGAVLVVILGYGTALIWSGRQGAGRGLLISGALLFVSITMRTLDNQGGAVCAALPIGTHFMWHVLNGALLGWLTVVMIRHGRPAHGLRRDGSHVFSDTGGRHKG
jgi:hypothetical protein